eukprot:1590492-Prymnesium_polylepis.2
MPSPASPALWRPPAVPQPAAIVGSESASGTVCRGARATSGGAHVAGGPQPRSGPWRGRSGGTCDPLSACVGLACATASASVALMVCVACVADVDAVASSPVLSCASASSAALLLEGRLPSSAATHSSTLVLQKLRVGSSRPEGSLSATCARCSRSRTVAAVEVDAIRARIRRGEEARSNEGARARSREVTT